jgi:phosphoglycerol transferase MdoB-like AlkP superfamily enzyme
MSIRNALERAVALVERVFLFAGAALFVMSLFRLGFLFAFGNGDELRSIAGDVLRALFLGARFDLVVICYLLFPVSVSLLLAVVWFRNRFLDRLEALAPIYCVVGFLAVSLVLASDFCFYSYFQDHINMMIFGTWEDDFFALARTLWKNYNVPLILAAALAYAVVVAWSVVRIFRVRRRFVWARWWNSGRLAPRLVLFVLGIPLMNGLGARGSLGVFPLNVNQAAISEDLFVNMLGINGVQALERAVRLRAKRGGDDADMAKLMGFSSGSEAVRVFLESFSGGRRGSPETAESLVARVPNRSTAVLHPHVIFILGESLGSEWALRSTAQFDTLGRLSRHFEEDTVFWNFFSGDNGTIGSLETLLVNLANRPGARALSESRYMQSKFGSGAHLPFARAGYETTFLYGGETSWRGLNTFLDWQGWDHVEGAASVRRVLGVPRDAGNDWGLYDEYLLEYLWRKLNAASRPQFIFVLTTTNHPPYSVPSHYSPRPLAMPQEVEARLVSDRTLATQRLLAYQYAADALGGFLDRLKSSSLAATSVVGVTGDHSFWLLRPEASQLMRRFAVPFYLYLPEALKKELGVNSETRSVFGSHVDVMPTLYHAALPDGQYEGVGRSLFDGTVPHFAGNGSGMVADASGLLFQRKFYRWATEPGGAVIPLGEVPTDSLLSDKMHRAGVAVSDGYVKSLKKVSATHSR